jgi:predicted enzyme related to lactoylglutathione lyase
MFTSKGGGCGGELFTDNIDEEKTFYQEVFGL